MPPKRRRKFSNRAFEDILSRYETDKGSLDQLQRQSQAPIQVAKSEMEKGVQGEWPYESKRVASSPAPQTAPVQGNPNIPPVYQRDPVPLWRRALLGETEMNRDYSLWERLYGKPQLEGRSAKERSTLAKPYFDRLSDEVDELIKRSETAGKSVAPLGMLNPKKPQ